jgi:predicted metallopeptidase
MPRVPGTSKTGGRKKGTPNKRSRTFQDYLESINFYVPEKIIEKIEALSDEDQVKYLFRMLEYIYPKRKSIDLQADELNISTLSFTEAVMGLDI